jgi:RNA polymerase sigma-70 factor (ECF subfamily)
LTAQDAVARDADLEIDRQLVDAIAAGSADALGRLYDRHAPVAFGLARRIVMQTEAAEEVVQDVFAQVWREAARYQRDRASVAGWIVMLTRARAIDHLRARRARPDLGAGATASPMPRLASNEQTPEDVAVSADDAARVRLALRDLPDTLRNVIDLAYYEGLTHSEIAARTGLPLGTVKTRLRSAMLSLREQLAGTPPTGAPPAGAPDPESAGA